ncbi:MAG: aminotransferase class V-fold PLP-dependent enzyme [Phycisphaerae bacterium]|nr:aminotransferase class V-fold PLP-dependent enzyme [Phycisphaerae bacterium]
MVSEEVRNKVQWMLDPDITYLNHGSFGARPVSVFEAQIDLKRQFERSPIQFLDREGKERVAEARATVAAFLGCSGEQLGFVENATTAIGCVLQSLDLPARAEIVSTSHVYNGVRQLLRAFTKKNGSTYREIDIQTPLHTSDEIVAKVIAGFSNHTKVLVLDHVASITSIVFPVKEIIAECRKRNITILIDGAHAPGMLELDIDDLAPDWYVGNLHKWVCGPPGAGFLWVNRDYLKTTHPLTVSHFFEQGFTEEFDWQGTRDITSILGAAVAIEWGTTIGWDAIRKHNHALVVCMQQRLIDTWGVLPMSSLDGSLIGSMATVPLPHGYPTDEEQLKNLRSKIYQEHKVEVPLLLWQGSPVVRVSAQLYTNVEFISTLISALSG